VLTNRHALSSIKPRGAEANLNQVVLAQPHVHYAVAEPVVVPERYRACWRPVVLTTHPATDYWLVHQALHRTLSFHETPATLRCWLAIARLRYRALSLTADGTLTLLAGLSLGAETM